MTKAWPITQQQAWGFNASFEAWFSNLSYLLKYLCVVMVSQRKWPTTQCEQMIREHSCPLGTRVLSSTGHRQSSIPNNAVWASCDGIHVSAMSTLLHWNLNCLDDSPGSDPVSSSWSMTQMTLPICPCTSQKMYTCKISCTFYYSPLQGDSPTCRTITLKHVSWSTYQPRNTAYLLVGNHAFLLRSWCLHFWCMFMHLV